MLRTKNRWMKKKKNKSIVVPLTLTSLVDAFSMLVIFLIASTTETSPFEATQNLQLPKVEKAQILADAPKITVAANTYYFGDKPMTLAQLKGTLTGKKELFKDKKAIVEADKAVAYEKIEPLMAVMSELEIESIQLAVSSEQTL